MSEWNLHMLKQLGETPPEGWVLSCKPIGSSTMVRGHDRGNEGGPEILDPRHTI